MPQYEYFCLNCNTSFEKILSLINYEEGGTVCPRCGSKNVEQRWSAHHHHIKEERLNARVTEAAMPCEDFLFGSLTIDGRTYENDVVIGTGAHGNLPVG